jgi:hypothetical protein
VSLTFIEKIVKLETYQSFLREFFFIERKCETGMKKFSDLILDLDP